MEDNNIPMKRPTRDDKDEDLVEMQNEFLRGKLQPCVEVKRMKNSQEPNTNKDDSVTVPTRNSELDENIKDHVPIITGIVERNISPAFWTPSSSAFSHINRLDKNVLMKSADENGKPVRKKKSIFMQQMEKQQKKISQSANKKDCSIDFPTSYIIDGSGLGLEGAKEAVKIHSENLTTINALSKEEIVEQQEELCERLDPNLINFIKSRRKNIMSSNKTVPKESSNTVAFSNTTATLPNYTSEGMSEEVLKLSGDGDRDGIILENIQDISSASPHSNEKAQAPHLENINMDIPEKELPLNPKECKKWLHMDKVEKNKLAWMTDLPKPKLDLKSGYTARFDFQGQLLSRSIDLPTQSGLYHHANEPEVAGYTVEELYLLARSSFQSQRIAALETLSHILENYWDGRFDDCFESSLLTTMLQAGLVPLLRWALDDMTIPSIAAAVLAIHRLLICRSDELCLDMTFCWWNGHISPFLSGEDIEPGVNLNELTDAKIIKVDVIRGFLRMDLLLRLRYILRILCPPKSVCQLVIEICTRIARHSIESADQVAKFPGLLDAVFQKFLPVDWQCNYKSNDTADFYCPMHSAMKLVRVIASASYELALFLLDTYTVSEPMKCYLTIDPSDKKLPPVEVQKLMIETLRTWKVYLSYGLCSEIYVDLLPILLRQFQFCNSISLNANLDVNNSNYEYAAHFMRALEAVVMTCLKKDNFERLIQSTNPEHPKEKYFSPELLWENVVPLLQNSITCLQKWMWEYTNGDTNYRGKILLSTCFSFLAVICEECSQRNIPDIKTIEDLLKNVIANYLIPCLRSEKFLHLLSSLRSSSLLLCQGTSGCKRDAKVLTTLGTVLWKADVVPLLKEETPFPLLNSLTGFIVACQHFLGTELPHDMSHEIYCILIKHPLILNYVEDFLSCKSLFDHWFDQYEAHFIYHLIQLSSRQESKDTLLWYGVALKLMQCMKLSSESYAVEILENIIFNGSHVRKIGISPDTICTSGSIGLEVIRDFYIKFYLCNVKERKVMKSFCFRSNMESIFDKGWCYYPLLHYYLQSQDKESSVALEELLFATKFILTWIHMNADVPCSATSEVPVSVVFCHLCFVFLIHTELFCDTTVKELLCLCLMDVLKQKEKLTFKYSWKDLPSFDKIFEQLMVQFEAVSYGDHLFASFLTVPLQQQYPRRWKIFLLSQHPQAVRFLGIPLKKLLVPIENYLEPPEKDENLLKEYLLILTSGTLTNIRSPLLFLMAIHHLHNFIITSDVKTQKTCNVFRNSLLHVKNKEIKHYIFNYARPDLNLPLGFAVSYPNQCCDS